MKKKMDGRTCLRTEKWTSGKKGAEHGIVFCCAREILGGRGPMGW